MPAVLFFAISFTPEAANRVALAMHFSISENELVYYMVRLLAYALILFSIIKKNRRPKE